MAKLFLVRHGQTDWNKDHKLMGIVDIPLNEDGKTEAKDISKKIAEYKIDVIYSSPLKRALETAEIISKEIGLNIKISESLKERDFGDLSGKSWEEISKITGVDSKEIDRKQEYDYTKYGGENALQVKERVQNFLKKIVGIGHSNILLVCHAGVIRAIESTKNEPRQIINSGSITEFEI